MVLRTLRQTKELSDQEGLCFFNMGTAHIKMKDFEAAMGCSRRAVSLLSRVDGQAEQIANCKNNLHVAEQEMKKKGAWIG